jgi:hypothetical protein
MVFKKLRELNSKALIYIGAILALIGYICFNLLKKTGLLNVILSVLSCFISLLGGFFLIWGSIKLKREKEQLGKAVTEEQVEKEEQGREKNNTKIIIAGVIVSSVVTLIGLGVSYYSKWYQKSEVIKDCGTKCCSYVEYNKVWVDQCDVSQNCTIVFGEIVSPAKCRNFSTQDLCINSCFTGLNKLMEPKIPLWLRILRNFY